MIILAFLLISSLSRAANFTVQVGGGGNYTTIQACATAMAAGDTCTVFAGTYNENVTVTAGTVGNYKTITVNGTDAVIVNSFTLDSHTKVLGNCGTPPTIQGSCGFSIQNTASPASKPCVSFVTTSSTDIYIAHNNLYACGKPIISSNLHPGLSFIYIQNNTLSYSGLTSSYNPSHTQCDDVTIICTGDAIVLLGSNVLIEGNDLSHYSLGIQFNLSNSVFRNNTFHDQNEYEGRGNHHTDNIFSEPGDGTTTVKYNLVEGNHTYNGVGANAKGTLAQGDACGGLCSNLIVRFNVLNRLGSAYLDNEITFPYVKVYNNTWADAVMDSGRNASNPGEIDHFNNTANGSDINNIFYFSTATTGSNPTGCDGTACSTLTYGHNLGYCDVTGSSNCLLYGHQYQSGSFAADPGNLYGRQDTAPTNNPLFVNFISASSTSDFHLSASSPALNAGTNLTTVAAGDAGSGTSLIVNDAAYFQDGLSLTAVGVQADCISITTVGNHICITAVNYATNTLTLASSVTRSVGDPIWLYSDSSGVVRLTGTAPNIGAFGLSPGGGSTLSGSVIASGSATRN